MADTSLFNNFRTVQDYNRLDQEFQLRKMKAARELQIVRSGANLPAAMQLANEYQRRVKSGDIEGANLLAQFAKTTDKGVAVDAGGNYVELPGYGTAVGGIAAEKAGQSQQAKKEVDYRMNPVIKGAEAASQFEQQLRYAPQIEQAKSNAKDIAGKETELRERMAGMPQLEDTVNQLSDLGKKATYTSAGRVYDTLRTEAGLEPRESAVARTEYESLVNNQVLPLLRQTFGAQFTEREGESLKKTLGDPNKSPAEKDAVLRSFINQKKATIESMQREITAYGVPNADGSTSLDQLLAGYESDPIGMGGDPVNNGNMVENLPQPKQVSIRDIPTAAVKYLRENPEQRAFFDQKYGAGAATQILGR